MSTPLTAAERERFDALAPFVDGSSLAPADALWLAECAQRDSGLAQELATHRALRGALRGAWADLPSDRGLAKALARLDQAESPAAAAAQTQGAPDFASASAPKPAATTRGGRAGGTPWWAWWFRPVPGWALAASVAFACIALPLAYQRGLDAEPDTTTVATRSRSVGAFDGPLIRLNLRPDVQEQALRQLLVGQGALAVGPTRLGDWYVKVAPARVAAVRAALAASPGVQSCDVVDALPPELVHTP